MLGLGTLTALIAKYGILIVAPIAVLEGPIVTVIAAWMASQGLMNIWLVFVVVVLADLIGDFGFYAIGRWGLHRLPQRWLDRLGLTAERMASLDGHFDQHGFGTLLLGKITHTAGFAVLAAAGLARMPMAKFMLYNVIGTIPKSLFFVALGYAFGAAFANINGWIGRFTLVMGVILLALAVGYLIRRKVRP